MKWLVMAHFADLFTNLTDQPFKNGTKQMRNSFLAIQPLLHKQSLYGQAAFWFPGAKLMSYLFKQKMQARVHLLQT